MKERFKQLPEPLQQQVLRRFAVAIVFVLLFLLRCSAFGMCTFSSLFALCRILYCKCLMAVLYLYQGRLYFGKRHLRPGGNDCDTKARKSLTLEYEEEVPRLFDRFHTRKDKAPQRGRYCDYILIGEDAGVQP